MVTIFSGWLCNLLFWTAVIATVALTIQTFAAPVINEVNALIGLGVSAVLSLFWPRL
jgi:hypothetical protein